MAFKSIAAVLLTAVSCGLSGMPAPAPAMPVPGLDRAAPGCPGASQVRDVMVSSAALGKPVAVRLYLPPCQPDAGRCFASVYLLHGAGTDQTQWSDIGIATAADDGRARGTLPPLILVIPFRSDDRVDPRPDGDLPYEHFVVADLIPWVDHNTPACPTGTQRAIGGISMGGWWALEIAFHHPELFAAVGGNSALAQRGSNLDPSDLLASNLAAIRALHVWLDVGDQDSLTSGDASLAAVLKADGVPTVFNQWVGSHNRTYWRAHVPDYLSFYASQFPPDSPQP